MTNEQFILKLSNLFPDPYLDQQELLEHARKLVAVAEAAKATYGATFDEDDGEGDGFYVGWEDYVTLGKALAQLEGGEDE